MKRSKTQRNRSRTLKHKINYDLAAVTIFAIAVICFMRGTLGAVIAGGMLSLLGIVVIKLESWRYNKYEGGEDDGSS